MTEQTQPRDHGRYSFKQQGAPTIELGGGEAPLPPLPDSAGIPEVSFDFSDAGKLETHVAVGGSTLSFWKDDMDGETTNSIDSGNFEVDTAPWAHIQDMEDFQQARTWGESVHERVEGATSQILESAVQSDDARSSIIAFATGRAAEAGDDPTPENASTKRIEQALSSYDAGEDDATLVQDLFTDLRHYADSRGIDLHQALDASYDNYLREKNDPAFKEGL